MACTGDVILERRVAMGAEQISMRTDLFRNHRVIVSPRHSSLRHMCPSFGVSLDPIGWSRDHTSVTL